MYNILFDHIGQTSLNSIEFLFNDKSETDFIYARNHEITLQLSDAILMQANIPYLAPKLVLLYKSSDIHREGYQHDFNSAIEKMDKFICWTLILLAKEQK